MYPIKIFAVKFPYGREFATLCNAKSTFKGEQDTIAHCWSVQTLAETVATMIAHDDPQVAAACTRGGTVFISLVNFAHPPKVREGVAEQLTPEEQKEFHKELLEISRSIQEHKGEDAA